MCLEVRSSNYMCASGADGIRQTHQREVIGKAVVCNVMYGIVE